MAVARRSRRCKRCSSLYFFTDDLQPWGLYQCTRYRLDTFVAKVACTVTRRITHRCRDVSVTSQQAHPIIVFFNIQPGPAAGIEHEARDDC